jgi:Mn-dependent DtxR family transcriptional regulator
MSDPGAYRGPMLTSVDREILVALLVGGADKPSNLAEICDRHDQSVQKRLGELLDADLVTSKGRGVYQLTVSGAETAIAIRRESSILGELDLDAPVNRSR